MLAYADIPAQFLDVLEPITGDRPRRISFAASFGVDDIAEYSDHDRSRAAALIRRFDAVSVREESGVRICRDEFGVRAEHHVDPTMLLTAEQYRELVSRAGGTMSPAAGRLLTIDSTRTTKSAASRECSPSDSGFLRSNS